MTYTLSQIRSRITELVPDVMKLDFGCEVLIKVTEEVHRNGVARLTILNSNETFAYTYSDTFGTHKIVIDEVKEILGRDPSLADVLRAIKVLNPPTFATDWNGLDYDEGTEKFERKTLGLIRKWDLSKPLSGQSQEVLDFLGEILK